MILLVITTILLIAWVGAMSKSTRHDMRGEEDEHNPLRWLGWAAISGVACFIIWSNESGFHVTKMGILSFMTLMTSMFLFVLGIAMLAAGYTIYYELDPGDPQPGFRFNGFFVASGGLFVTALAAVALVLVYQL